MMHDLKALRYDWCLTRGSHGFTCHPHTNHTCLYSQPQGITVLAGTNLYCLVREAHRCEELAQSFYAVPHAQLRLESTTSWSLVRHTTDSATTPCITWYATVFLTLIRGMVWKFGNLHDCHFCLNSRNPTRASLTATNVLVSNELQEFISRAIVRV